MPSGSRTAIKRLWRQAEQRVGALDLAQRVGDAILDRALRAHRDQMDDDFGVARALEDRAASLELFAQRLGVRQVAVVGDRDRAARVVDRDRLRVFQERAAGGRVAHVADGVVAAELRQLLGREDVDDVAHPAVRTKAAGRRS